MRETGLLKALNEGYMYLWIGGEITEPPIVRNYNVEADCLPSCGLLVVLCIRVAGGELAGGRSRIPYYSPGRGTLRNPTLCGRKLTG